MDHEPHAKSQASAPVSEAASVARQPAAAAADTVGKAAVPPSQGWRGLFRLRGATPLGQSIVFGVLSLLTVLGLWWLATSGETPQDRWLGPYQLKSPAETFRSFGDLWKRDLVGSILITLRRVVLGFSLAAAIGVPIGVLCGCFSWINAFFAPLTAFGRNIPIAALSALMFAIFGVRETEKVMFIFFACVAFIVADTARGVTEVGSQYVDTAYTLGANRRQVIMKVLVPLALPGVFNSLRLLFGLAFGYIMLVETIRFPGESGGLGDIINTSMKRGLREHVVLVLLIVPVLAWLIDRMLFWIQRELFPHRYGGAGWLLRCVQAVQHLIEDVLGLFWTRGKSLPDFQQNSSGTGTGQP